MKLFLHVHTKDRSYKPILLRARDAFDPSQHPRGHPGNKGEFAKKGSGSPGTTAQTTQPRYAPARKTATKTQKTPQPPKPPAGTPNANASIAQSQARVSAAVSTYNASGKSDADQEKALTDITKAVFDFMGIDKSVGINIEPPFSFTVGGKRFMSGGKYDPQEHTVTICTNTNPAHPGVAGLVSHEAMHAKFDAVKRVYDKESDAIFDDTIKGEEVQLPDGRIAPKFQAKYPVHAQAPNGFGGDLSRFQKDDGITEYSKAYWKGASMGSNDASTAIDETIAEMARLDREGTLSNLPWFQKSKTYRPLYEAIHNLYPTVIGKQTTDAWEESKHPRGHPGNPGQFVSKGQGTTGSTARAAPLQRSETRTKPKTTEVGGHQLPLNPDGTVTLYHATKSREKAQQIVQSKQLKSAGEPSVYLSTSKSGTGYGDHVVAVHVHPKHLEIDDEFPDGRADFRIDKSNVDVKHAEHVEPSQESPQAAPASTSLKFPEAVNKYLQSAPQDEYWRFGDQDDRLPSTFHNLKKGDNYYTLVMSKESDDWELVTPDEDIKSKGQENLEKALIDNELLEKPKVQEQPPQTAKADNSKPPTMPSALKQHMTQFQDNYWTFEPSGDRFMSQHYNIDTPGGSASLVLSKESPDWHLFLLDAPEGKENIFGQGQDNLEKELIKNGLLSAPTPALEKPAKMPKGVKITAKSKTKSMFADGDHEEEATGYAIDDELLGRRYVILSEETGAWKMLKPGTTIGRRGRGQESLNDALANYHPANEIPKPISGSQADLAASDLSKIRVAEASKRYQEALTSPKAEEAKTQALYDIGHAVMEYVGLDKSVGLTVGETHKFKVGDKEYVSGGQFSPMNNLISIYTNNNPLDAEAVAQLASHESMHAKFDAVGRAYRRETNQFGKLSYEEQEKVMAPDGSIRDAYKDQYPLHHAMPISFLITKGSSREKLQEDDGVTDYSRAYWEAVKSGGERNDPILAVNETLAEMAKLDREGSLPRLLWYKNSKTYKPLYQLINKYYPHAVEVLNS